MTGCLFTAGSPGPWMLAGSGTEAAKPAVQLTRGTVWSLRLRGLPGRVTPVPAQQPVVGLTEEAA